MIYFAHRGASAQRVQNSLPAFALAREQGATHYELDLHLTKDRFLVVHHDHSLLSTTGHDVQLGGLTLADLKKYPLQNPFDSRELYIPSLKEVLPVIVEDLQLFNLEFKNEGNCYPGREEHTLQVLNTFVPEVFPKTLFSSFDYETLVRIRQLNKSVRIGLLTRSFDIAQALSLRAESIHLNAKRFSPEMVQICHDNGLKLYLYTVNDLETARQLEWLGVDGIFTDRIDLFTNRK